MARHSFEEVDGGVKCTIHRKGGKAEGIAYMHSADKCTKLAGETIAYLKAERNYAKNKMIEYKSKLKYLEYLQEYLFPNKFYGKQVDWIKNRLLEEIRNIKQEYEYWKLECEGFDKEIIAYFKKRADNKKKIDRIKKINSGAALFVDGVYTEK